MRRNKTITEPVFVPEDLKQFEGWEIRKINTSDYKPGIIMQNPDTGEKRKLLMQPCCFDGEYLKVIRGKRQPASNININKKGVIFYGKAAISTATSRRFGTGFCF